MGNYKKVFQSQFKAICNKCDHVFDLTKELMKKQYIRHGDQPESVFSARSSLSTVFCPNCNHNEFRLDFEYKNIYRRRCPKCGKMFETEESWKYKCDSCVRTHAELMASMGPG